ncbi:flagellin N-terminal helical domain-containing protein [Geminicoccus roseus]|uniref:flagellin N-terminal helical domain-containing protein n=1 Tax=Geminicoccus roseus TaxID=404900 RepID=UPI00042190C3|nr:flagellin [Geminicoccus roseus]
MVLTATTNVSANTALRYLSQNSAAASSSLAKLSSGSRIVKGSDDAASLAVGTRLKADVTALKQAASNTAQGQSLLQVADGGMSKVADILQRMKALAVQSQSGSLTDNERQFLNQEYSQLNTQVGDIASQTKFNGAQLLNGSAGKTLTVSTSGAFAKFEGDGDLNANFRGVTLNLNGAATGNVSFAYVGADSATGTHATDATIGTFTLTYGNVTDTIQLEFATDQRVVEGQLNFRNAGVSISLSNFDFSTELTAESFTVGGGGDLTFQVGAQSADTVVVNIDDMTTTALGTAGTDISTSAGAVTAGDAIDQAIAQVNGSRAELGAMMSRFEFSAANLATSIENLDAARSTLMDVDMAAEMSRFTSANILTQASVSMLAQANQMPQTMLQLLR